MQNQYDSNGQPIRILNRNQAQSTLIGYPINPTTHMPSNSAVLGNWADFVVGEWGMIALMADPYGSNFASGATSVRAIMPINFAVRHTASFVKAVQA